MKGCRFADSDCLNVPDGIDANGTDANWTTGTLESN